MEGNLLLVSPWTVAQSGGAYSNLPMGTVYINSAIRNAGFNVFCLAFTGEKDADNILRKTITENEIEIVLCGGLTFQYRQIKHVNKIVKDLSPQIITIGGGGGFTAEPLLFPDMCLSDYAVIGEGDFSTPELIDAIIHNKDVSKIKGIVYKENEEYIYSGVREAIADLDTIPFPSYEGFPIEKILNFGTPISGFNTFFDDKPKVLSMVYSRSCPFKCSFCFHPTGDKYRTRSMDNFFEELDGYVQKYDFNGLAIIDECFRMDESMFEFCKRLKKYKLKFVVSLVAKTVTPEKLNALKEAGCCSVSYGIESMSETVLRDMHKPANVEVIERALKMTVNAGISVQGNLIFGAEAENSETVKETLHWWLTHREYQLALNLVTPYPGSLYYEHCLRRGIIKDKREYIEMGCPWVNMSQLSDHEYERLMILISMPADAKVAWDSACHGEIIETVPTYEGDDNRVSMKLKCFHCGKTHVYGNLPKQGIQKAFYMPCRSCGMLSTYGELPSFNYQLLSQWMKNEAIGESLSQWIERHGFTKVVVYGMGELGCTLFSYLKKIGVAVGASDSNEGALVPTFEHTAGTILTSVSEINCLNPDLVIVAPSYDKAGIIKKIRENGFHGRIETLFDICFGIADAMEWSKN